jgi:hypothetical protein
MDQVVITTARWATDVEIRLGVAQWEEVGSPLSDIVAQTIARWWGERFERTPNLRAFGHGREFNLADALEECLTIASAYDDTVTALWEYLEDKR